MQYRITIYLSCVIIINVLRLWYSAVRFTDCVSAHKTNENIVMYNRCNNLRVFWFRNMTVVMAVIYNWLPQLVMHIYFYKYNIIIDFFRLLLLRDRIWIRQIRRRGVNNLKMILGLKYLREVNPLRCTILPQQAGRTLIIIFNNNIMITDRMTRRSGFIRFRRSAVGI
jgi:hypothetical protein